MKRLLFFCLAIALSGLYFTLQNSDESLEDLSQLIPVPSPVADGRMADKYAPDDHFFMSRTYPDFKFATKSYQRALEDVRRDRKEASQNQQRSFDESWINQGPTNIGGRITALAVDPNASNIVYAGTPRGGVFKTTDDGNSWQPIFDEQSFLTIGDIEIDPNNSNVLYVGTGDKDISSHVGIGDGLYKSIDAGQTWEHLGFTEDRIISRVEVHPTNSDLLYVATMGIPFERNTTRGLYLSEDAGESWNNVLQLGEAAGVTDILIHPTNPDIIYAAGWNRIRNNTESVSYGIDGKVWKTSDRGVTWEFLEGNWPTDSLSRIGLAMDPEDPEVIYAEIVNQDHGFGYLMKWDADSTSWESLPITLNGDGGDILGNFGWYFGKVRINPFNRDQIFVLGVDLWMTEDQGQTWAMKSPIWWTYEVHADKHDLVFLDEFDWLLATDGGIYRTQDGGVNWYDYENLPNTQLYHVQFNPHASGDIWAGAQDNGTMSGQINGNQNFQRRWGGDGFQPRFHPVDAGMVFAEVQWGSLYVSYDGGFSFSGFVEGIDQDDRINWDMPYIISEFPPHDMYCGSQRVYRANAATLPWQPISEDLTKGPIFGPRYHDITNIAESKFHKGEIFVGTTDGRVQYQPADSTNWVDITTGLPDRYVTSIQTSPADANILYVSHSGYKDNDFIPHLHQSFDKGATWVDISGNLPQIAINDIAVNSIDPDLIFAATDGGVYYTIDGGLEWLYLGTGMPVVPVFDVEINEADSTLAAGSFARSMFTMNIKDLLEEEEVVIIDSGIENFDGAIQIKIYPNPVVDYLQIEMIERLNLEAEYSLQIFDQSGKLIHQQDIESNSSQVDLASLASGFYVLKIEGEGRTYQQKILKKG